MRTHNPISVVILCKNEIENIGPCLDSARWIADEILVADSGSTDGTLEFLRSQADCRVVEREYVDYGNFANWAIPQARHPWVFILDADERITPELAAEIRAVFEAGPQHDGYRMFRANYFLGRRIRFSGWQSDDVLRLFRKDVARYAGDNDHATAVVATGRVKTLRSRLTHFTCRSYEQYFRKFHRYTAYQAERWQQAGRRSSGASMFFRFLTRFLHGYIFRLGFLDGRAGLQLCLLTGFYSFMKQARLWELEQHAGNSASGDRPAAAKADSPQETPLSRAA